MSKRHQSQTERDLEGIAARREREAAPVGVVSGEITDRYEGEELLEMRKKRPTDERIGHLETKHDELVKVVTEIRVDVGKMSGQLDVLPELVSVVRATAERAAEREHVTFTAKVDVDRAQQLDVVDARQAKRKFWLSIAAAVVGGGGIAKLLHFFGVM